MAAGRRDGVVRPLRIAVASGKGGTGKTTVATSLALSLVHVVARPLLFLDCDVEAPNAHIFLRPVLTQRQDVAIMIPRIDEARCTACGRCAQVCEYHAIAVVGKKTLVFPQLCHGCGSCTLVCPEGAITEVPQIIGALEAGETPEGIRFARGVLNIGEPMATPVIRQLKRWALSGDGAPPGVAILDVPPGTSCPVVESVRGSDFLLLVTEPTPFGLHDLRLAVDVAAELGIPAGIVLNRDGIGNDDVETFAAGAGTPILMRIPFDRAIAEGVAQGRPLIELFGEYEDRFRVLYEQIAHRVWGAS